MEAPLDKRKSKENTNDPPPIISFHNVTKIFNTGKDENVYACSKLNFEIKEHEIVSFVGPSGCGKTTVLRIISGLDVQTHGEVKIKNESAKLGRCGMVFQSYSSFPWLAALDNVAFGLKILNKDKETRYKIARDYIKLVGLENFEVRYPKELSGGQKQRVAIARSLAVENEILLMDEPFGALDIKIRSEMQEFLLTIWRKLKPTIILVTHDIQEAIYLPNRIFVFSKPVENPDKIENYEALKVIEIKKKLEDRTPEWKKSEEFDYYEKQIKELQYK